MSDAGNSATTLASDVYERLRRDILQGALKPGFKLRIDFVCKRYEVGNSPMREALNRLSSEGLVERRDQRGFFVAGIGSAELRELVKTRCWLEGLALRESIAARTIEWEERIVLAFHRLSRTPRSVDDRTFHANAEWEKRHKAFHESLIAACGSRQLLRFCADLRDQADRYRLLAAAYVYPGRDEGDEHRSIMNAAIDGRTDQAVDLLTQHYRATQAIIEQAASDLLG